jgi:hypothetical protein
METMVAAAGHASSWPMETPWKEKGVGKGSVCFADGMLYLWRRRRQAGCHMLPRGPRECGEFNVEGEGTSWAHPVVIGGRLTFATTTISTVSTSKRSEHSL